MLLAERQQIYTAYTYARGKIMPENYDYKKKQEDVFIITHKNIFSITIFSEPCTCIFYLLIF